MTDRIHEDQSKGWRRTSRLVIDRVSRVIFKISHQTLGLGTRGHPPKPPLRKGGKRGEADFPPLAKGGPGGVVCLGGDTCSIQALGASRE